MRNLLALLGSKVRHATVYKSRSPLEVVHSSSADARLLNCDSHRKTISSSIGHHQYPGFCHLQKSHSLITFSSQAQCNEKNVSDGLKVQIISVENIKPSVSTPHHLRKYELSSLDQLYPNFYSISVYFYRNNDQHVTHKLISDRILILKQSLSETLNQFYPLAGKVQADLFIDCNDEGVYFVDAKVNSPIYEILDHPDNKSMHQLLPFKPTSPELVSKSYVIYIKATVFSCGGMAIGLCTSHKIIDGSSLTMFVNAWAATARGSQNNISPSFTSPSVFLHHPSLNSKAFMELFLAHSQGQGKKVTRRFVFSAKSLENLKNKAEAPSRVFAVIGLIWKCAMSSFTEKQLSSVLMLYVNIREKSSPPLPPFSVGNIFLHAIAQCRGNDYNPGGIPSLVRLLKTASDQVNSDEIERMKGKDGFKVGNEYYDALRMLICKQDTHLLPVSSMCNSGLYEADFGCGKPVWARVGSTDSKCNLGVNLIYLMDTRCGNGIEAQVTLSESDMVVLENDMELLSYATLNPSPLQTVDELVRTNSKTSIK